MTTKVYADFTQEELDWVYNNRDRVPNHPELLTVYAARGASYIEQHPHHLDIPFGASAEETLDIYPALDGDGPRPVLIYFHGGYWYSRHKDDFRFIAEGFTDAGITVVVVNYALIPSVDMAELIRQCRASVAWTQKNISEFGGDPNRLFVSGHSAGGHITAMMFASDWEAMGVPASAIAGGFAISGLYDLEPIRLSNMNETLGFTEDTVRDYSPVHLAPSVNAPMVFAVGGDETSEFLRHNELLREDWNAKGVEIDTMVAPGLNHFSILGDFSTKGGVLNSRMRQLAGVA